MMDERDPRKLSLMPDEPEPDEEDTDEEKDEEEEDEDNEKTEGGTASGRNERQFHTGAAQAGQPEGTQPQQGLGRGAAANAKRATVPPPFIPMVPHEDHVKVLVAEAQADEANKFAANRLQIEQINATQDRITKAMKDANLGPILYPEMDFSPNDKIREAGMKAQQALSDNSAQKKNLEATKKARAERDKVRQKAAQGGVAVE